MVKEYEEMPCLPAVEYALLNRVWFMRRKDCITMSFR